MLSIRTHRIPLQFFPRRPMMPLFLHCSKFSAKGLKLHFYFNLCLFSHCSPGWPWTKLQHSSCPSLPSDETEGRSHQASWEYSFPFSIYYDWLWLEAFPLHHTRIWRQQWSFSFIVFPLGCSPFPMLACLPGSALHPSSSLGWFCLKQLTLLQRIVVCFNSSVFCNQKI